MSLDSEVRIIIDKTVRPAPATQADPDRLGSLRQALEELSKDRAFLKAGGVFDDDFIDSYIDLKMTEVIRFEHTRIRSSSRCTIRRSVLPTS